MCILLIVACCTSCISQRHSQTALVPEGTLLERDGDRFLVLLPDVGGKPHAYTYLWIYQPGLGMVPLEDLEFIITIKPKY